MGVAAFNWKLTFLETKCLNVSVCFFIIKLLSGLFFCSGKRFITIKYNLYNAAGSLCI